MSVKTLIKSRVCRLQVTQNYPLTDFTLWAAELGLGHAQLSQELEELRLQLATEAEALHRHSPDPKLLFRQINWYLYCTRLCDYYQGPSVQNPSTPLSA